MFWGLIMEPERRYTQKVKKPFHISMAAIDISSSGEEPAQVMCGYEGRNYLLCTLRKPDMIQCQLDLEFSAGSEVSFASNGKAHIHLTGYLTTIEDELSGELDDLEEEEEEYEEVEEEQLKEKKVSKKRDNKSKALHEAPPKKKAKTNGIPDGISDEEEDSDEDNEDQEEEESSDEQLEEEDEGEEVEEEEEEEKPVEEKPEKASKKKKQKQEQQKKVNGEPKKMEKKVKQQEPKMSKRVTLEKGVVVEDLKAGEGAVAKAGKFVTVYYEGRLEKNNKVFDSSNKGPGFRFRLGTNEVIKGWDIGLVGMKVGGKRKIICPPQTAYGAKGSPPSIPPNSTLVFTVEMRRVN